MPSITRQRVLRASALTAAVSLIASGLVVLGGGFASAIAGEVGGMVFRDFNSNGRYDTGNDPFSGVPDDVPLPGVTVTVYDALDTQLAQVTSDDEGTYAATTGRPDGTPVRVEFSGLPDGYFPTFQSGAGGIANGTSVQFANVGAESVDFGANLPEEYNQGATWLAAPLHIQGDPSVHPDQPSIKLIPAVNPDGAGYEPPVVATQGQTGTVWGTAWDSADRTLYAAAVYKRQSGLGALGIGGIYRLPGLLDDDNTIAPAPVEAWLDVETLDVAGTSEKVQVGDVPGNAERGLNGHGQPAVDADAYQRAGKVGILGIAVSPDGKTLYFLNGYDRELYAVDIADPTITPTQATRIPLGLADGERPWAVETRNGQLYVGYVQTGEDLPPGSTAADGDLSFTVVATPSASPGAWTPVLSAPLDYPRQPGTWFANAPAASRWNAWVDVWSWDEERNGVRTVASTRVNSSGQEYYMQVFPQAVLSDLSFDRDGYLVVTLMDRVAMQGGLRNYPTDGSTPVAHYIARVVGDVLVAAPDGGGWELENDGTVGDRVTSKPAARNVNAGPGGGEFIDDYAPSNISLEEELTIGSAVVPPGLTTVAVAGSDVIEDETNGVLWFDLERGAQTDNRVTVSHNFSKAPGLGGMDDLALAAPVQIGNRVWFDADQNGRQDADEPAVPGVTVQLRDAQGTVLATTGTDAAGEYYFSSNEIDGFTPDAEYSVRFLLPDTGQLFAADPRFGTVAWSAVGFTTRASSQATPTTDSNADASGDTGLFAVGGPGRNDHSIDAGLTADVLLELRKQIDPDGAPALPGQRFDLVVSATDFRGTPYQTPGGPTYSVTVGPDGAAVVPVPVGTTVTVSEDDSDDRIESYTVSPSGPILVDGTAQSPTIVTVTNRLRTVPGTFTLGKTLSGTGEGAVPADAVFTAEWATSPDGPWTTIEFTTASPAGPGRDFQAGTVIYLRELAPPAVPGVEWGTPGYTGATVVDGLARFTIIGNTTVGITIENPATGFGGFDLSKTVTGTGSGAVPADRSFTVQYVTDDPAHPGGELTVTPGSGGGEGVDGLPVGTRVTLTEVAPVGPDWVEWGTPVFSGPGVDDHGDGSASFTIGAVERIAIGLENPVTLIDHDVELTKRVVGPGEGHVAANAEFTVRYEWTAGMLSGSGDVTVRHDETVRIPDVPRGAVLTLSELALPDVPGIAWGAIHWSGPGVTDHGNGTATVQVGDAVVELELENTAELLTSGFGLSKLLSGSGSGAVPGGTGFEIEYALDGVAQPPLVITPSQGASVDDIPHGTVVTLTEVNLPVLPYIEWGTPTWRVNGQTVGNGATYEFTIDAATPVVMLELENPVTLLTGSFEISKAVTGPGQGRVADGFTFGGSYTWPGGAGTFEVEEGGTWTLTEPLPAGTEVTVSEIVPTGGLPDGYGWATPRYRIDGGDPQSGPVVIVIGDGTTVSIEIENPTTVNDGDFTITKEVTGPGTVADDFLFSGTYTYEGQTSAGTFEVAKDGTWSSEAIPMGTVVTITEITPTGGLPDGMGWGIPQFVIDGQSVGTSAQITIGNETTVAVVLRNPTTEPKVDIEKGDGVGDTIEHDADTVDDAEGYAPGETRTIVIRVQNTGDEDLQNVQLSDVTLAGAAIQSLVWTFPDGTTTEAAFAGGVWSAQWEETFGADPTAHWAPGDWISGTATLTVSDSPIPHADNVVVDAVGRFSGVPVTDEDRYYGFSAAIQLIKYDGEKPDPDVTNGSDWITPVKPMEDPYQDANTMAYAVEYPINAAQRVRLVATNTGQTWLTEVDLSDTTWFGPDVKAIVADLSPLGGPDVWDFVAQGPWVGPWEPGASFFLEGELTLPAETTHGNLAVLTAVVVTPAVDDNGKPTGSPAMEGGLPVQATHEDGTPWTLTDNDPFHAYTGAPPPLPSTGAGAQPWPLALMLVVAGAALLAATRLTGRRTGRHRIEPAA